MARVLSESYTSASQVSRKKVATSDLRVQSYSLSSWLSTFRKSLTVSLVRSLFLHTIWQSLSVLSAPMSPNSSTSLIAFPMISMQHLVRLMTAFFSLFSTFCFFTARGFFAPLSFAASEAADLPSATGPISLSHGPQRTPPATSGWLLVYLVTVNCNADVFNQPKCLSRQGYICGAPSCCTRRTSQSSRPSSLHTGS